MTLVRERVLLWYKGERKEMEKSVMTSKRLSHSMILPQIMWTCPGWQTNNKKMFTRPFDHIAI